MFIIPESFKPLFFLSFLFLLLFQEFIKIKKPKDFRGCVKMKIRKIFNQ